MGCKNQALKVGGLFNTFFFCTCLVTPVDCFLVCGGMDDKDEMRTLGPCSPGKQGNRDGLWVPRLPEADCSGAQRGVLSVSWGRSMTPCSLQGSCLSP